jgi:hypothetical protein
MRVLAIAALVALAARPGLGETAARGAVTVAPGGAIEIAAAPCAALVPGADYAAGVDAAGQAVAPADLPRAAPPIAAEGVAIEIDAQLAGSFGIPATGGAYRAKTIVGIVTVRDGSAYFNGAPLAADASAAIVAACRAARN